MIRRERRRVPLQGKVGVERVRVRTVEVLIRVVMYMSGTYVGLLVFQV